MNTYNPIEKVILATAKIAITMLAVTPIIVSIYLLTY